MPTLAPWVAIGAALALGACTLPGFGPRGMGERLPRESQEVALLADDFTRSRIIAADFVDAMVQIPALVPRLTTLVTARPDSRFGQLLLASLQDAGYELRIGTGADRGGLAYAITADEPASDESSGASGVAASGASASERTWTFLVAAHGVKLKRSYRVDDAGVAPASSMFVHGADASRLALDPTRFDRSMETLSIVPPDASPLAPGIAPRSEPRDPMVPGLSAGASASERGVSVLPGPSAISVVAAEPLQAPAAGTLSDRWSDPAVNMYDTRRSQFSPILERYDTLERSIMVFPNDSLVMGQANKRLTREMVQRLDPARDVVSVIGCSHGPSAVSGGNAALANGRAARVKEEFMLAGVAPDLVLEEGCWASRHFPKMPARGVVVTHKRRADDT